MQPTAPDLALQTYALGVGVLDDLDPRYILPLWRNTAAYHSLRELGISYERSHHIARVRNKLAGKEPLLRPKRIGRDWHQLRANASVVANWLRILDRQGWLPQTIHRAEPLSDQDAVALACELDDRPPWASRPEEWEGREIHQNDVTGEEFVYGDARNRERPFEQDGSQFVSRMNAERRREGLTGRTARRPSSSASAPSRPASLERAHVNLDTGEICVLPAGADTAGCVPASEALADREPGRAPPGHHTPAREHGAHGAPADEPAGPS